MEKSRKRASLRQVQCREHSRGLWQVYSPLICRTATCWRRAGARAVRFLENLGVGREPVPAGEDDATQLENKVTGLITRFPCVVVCVYDVRTLPGRMILKGGLEQHRLVVCPEGVRENPHLPARRGHGPPNAYPLTAPPGSGRKRVRVERASMHAPDHDVVIFVQVRVRPEISRGRR